MPTINAIIVDDEALARLNIHDALDDYPHWQVVAELPSATGLVDQVLSQPVDVVFLDINMPGTDGISIAQELVALERCPLLVFVTAYDTFAVNAFELSALDYLLKPFDNHRFANTIERIETALASPEPSPQAQDVQRLANRQPLHRLAVRSGASVRFIDINDILYILTSGNYVEIHHCHGTHLLRISLSQLNEHLDTEHFCRVHRTAIVRVDTVKQIKSLDDNRFQLLLSNDDTVPLSAQYKAELLQRLRLIDL